MRRSLCFLLLVVTSACGPRELRVTMNSDNNSGQSGFAVLIDRGGKGVSVTVETSAPEHQAPQPAHIHTGTCGEIGEKVGFLTELTEKSGDPEHYQSLTPDLGSFNFDMLGKTQKYVINVHDARDISIWVSCGEIPNP